MANHSNRSWRAPRKRHRPLILALIVLVLIPGLIDPILTTEAQKRLVITQRTALGPLPDAAPQPLQSLAQSGLVPPSAPPLSGARPAYPLNHTMEPFSWDGANPVPDQVGTPPVNHDFETPGYVTGDNAANFDLEAAPSASGTPPTNHDFSTGDFTGWATNGAPTIESDATYGNYARLGSGASITTDAFTVGGDAQVFKIDLLYISTTGASGTDVYVLSGPSFSSSAHIAWLSCSQCGAWGTEQIDASPYRGQTIKLRFVYAHGPVGIDAPRPVRVFADHDTLGQVRRVDEAGGNSYAQLTASLSTQGPSQQGAITSAPVSVTPTTQYLSVQLRGQSTLSPQAYVYVLSGPNFATVTQVAYLSGLPNEWTTHRVNVAGFQGEEIRLRVTRNLGVIGVDNLAVGSVEVPGWTPANETSVSPTVHVTGTTADPAGVRGSVLTMANGRVTSDSFVIDPETQQLSIAYRRATSGSSSASFSVSLLTGPNLEDVVSLAPSSQAVTSTEWNTLSVPVSPWAGQTVRLRITKGGTTSSVALFDVAGNQDVLVPGWRTTAYGSALTVGRDAYGTFVSGVTPSSRYEIQSSLMTPGVIDATSGTDARFFAVGYALTSGFTDWVRIYWTNSATNQTRELTRVGFVNSTAYQVSWFRFDETDGSLGYLTIRHNRGRLYFVGENVPRQQLAEPYAPRVGAHGVTVDAVSGAYHVAHTDLEVAGGPLPLELTRYYHGHSFSANGVLGAHWSHTYETRVQRTSTATNPDVAVIWGSGEETFFRWIGSPTNAYRAIDPRTTSVLARTQDGGWTLTLADGTRLAFMGDGRLHEIRDKSQNALELAYGAVSNRLTSVTDAAERSIAFTYDAMSGRLLSVTGPEGMGVTYDYDTAGQLVSATDTTNNVRTYGYERQRLRVLAEASLAQPVQITLDRFHRATEIRSGTGPGLTLAYATPGAGATTVTDGANGATIYWYDAWGRTVGTQDPVGRITLYTYTSHGFLTQTTNPDGSVQTYVYDQNGNLQIITDPNGNLIELAYNAQRKPTVMIDGRGKIWTYVYDLEGNLLEAINPLGEVTAYTYTDGTEIAVGSVTAKMPPGLLKTITVDAGSGRLNLVTAYAYDRAGNLRTKTIDPGTDPDDLNLVWAWTYDSAGRVKTETDPNGHTWTYSYSLRGLVTEIKNPLGEYRQFLYDGPRNLILAADAGTTPNNPNDDLVTAWTYDDRGLVTTKTDPAGKVWGYTYDDAGRMTTATDPLGYVTAYTYDEAGRLVSVTVDPLDPADPLAERLALTTTYTYNEVGLLEAVTDPLGRVTAYRYDPAGQLIQTLLQTSTPGNEIGWEYRYDGNGNRTMAIDPYGIATVWTYDDANRLVAVTVDPVDPNQPGVPFEDFTTTYTFDRAGRQTAVTVDAGSEPANLNQTTATSYDRAGRVTDTTDPLGWTWRYGYDPAGNAVWRQEPDRPAPNPNDPPIPGTIWESEYDALNRITKAHDPSTPGAFTEYRYDVYGRQHRVIAPSGLTSASNYDPRGLLLSVVVDPGTDPANLNLTTSYTYDDAGRQISQTNPRGKTTTFSYDAAGRLTTLTDPLNAQVALDYDDASQLLGVTNARGMTTSYTYDLLGNVLTETDPLNRVWSSAYNPVGRLTSTEDPRGVTQAYGYDRIGRLTALQYTYPSTIALPDGGITFTYDRLGRRTTMTDPTGTTNWTYDAGGQTTAIAAPQGTISYTYDEMGRRATMTLPALPGGDPRTVTYDYDAAGRLIALTDWNSEETAFSYDLDGRRATVLRPNGVGTEYQYDRAGRLSLIEHGDAGPLFRAVYSLDANGNRTSMSWTGEDEIGDPRSGSETYGYDDLDRLISVIDSDTVQTTYTYDANGNRTALSVNGGLPIGYSYDDADQLVATDASTLSYDAAGNLVTDGVSGAGYTYDWANRLVGATVGGNTVSYSVDGGGVRTGRTHDDGTTVTSEPYLWDRASGLPLLVDDGQQAILHAGGPLAGIAHNDDTGYPLTDALGSVRSRTDSLGEVVSTADYDVWGVGGDGGRLGFNGELSDSVTGLVHLRARDYAPSTGRFTSRDSLFPAGGGTQGYQRYAYANNNPTTMVDPSGHMAYRSGNLEETIAWAQANFGGVAGAFLTLALVFNCILYGDCVIPEAARQHTISWSHFHLRSAPMGHPLLPLGPLDPCNFDGVMFVSGGISGTAIDRPPQCGAGLGSTLRDLAINLVNRRIEQDSWTTLECFRAFTSGNFRHNLVCLSGADPPNHHAHHVFPQQFERDQFNKVFAPSLIHWPVYGHWWEKHDHLSKASAYNKRWEAFFGQFAPSLPTSAQVRQFGYDVMLMFGQTPRYFLP